MSNKFSGFRIAFVCSAFVSALFVSGCETMTFDDQKAETKQVENVPVPEMSFNTNDYYQVEHEGRNYIFDDKETYLSFLSVGETPYRLTRIGAGKNGETIVFGLTKKDKNKTSGIGSIMMYDNAIKGSSEAFYAEIYRDSRIYVFDNWRDVQAFRSVGEAPYRYTDIGSGPGGKTVVYVLNKSNKKARPDALIARFRAVHSL